MCVCVGGGACVFAGANLQTAGSSDFGLCFYFPLFFCPHTHTQLTLIFLTDGGINTSHSEEAFLKRLIKLEQHLLTTY